MCTYDALVVICDVFLIFNFWFVFSRILRLEKHLNQKKQILEDLREKLKDANQAISKEKENLVCLFVCLFHSCIRDDFSSRLFAHFSFISMENNASLA